MNRILSCFDALPMIGGVFFAGLIGLIAGSFIATLVLRWPAGQSVLGRSHCDGCGRPLRVWELVPLLSALWTRGACARCGVRIDPFHGRVEIASGLIGVAALALLPGTAGWLWALFGWLLLPLALLDARHFWLPDRLSAVLAIAGLFLAGPMLGVGLLDRWIGALAGGLVLAAIAWAYRRLRGDDGMGGGDPKLVAAIGCWLGWQALPLILLLASFGGILWALVAKGNGDRAQGKGDRPLARRPVPFGLFVCTAAWATVALWPLLIGSS